eukprot:COSAG04_NODE_2063_length_4880_cov_2.501987_4_plen_83_part_00
MKVHWNSEDWIQPSVVKKISRCRLPEEEVNMPTSALSFSYWLSLFSFCPPARALLDTAPFAYGPAYVSQCQVLQSTSSHIRL